MTFNNKTLKIPAAISFIFNLLKHVFGHSHRLCVEKRASSVTPTLSSNIERNCFVDELFLTRHLYIFYTSFPIKLSIFSPAQRLASGHSSPVNQSVSRKSFVRVLYVGARYFFSWICELYLITSLTSSVSWTLCGMWRSVTFSPPLGFKFVSSWSYFCWRSDQSECSARALAEVQPWHG